MSARRVLLPMFLVALCVTACAPFAMSQRETGALDYPKTRQVDHQDDYHGTTVADPYRWLEELEAQDTREWIEAQNEVTFGFLGKIDERQQIRNRVEQLWNYEKFGIPFREGDRFFYRHNSGLQNQSVLRVVDTPRGKHRELLDPNTLSKDGTVSVRTTSVSPDGKLMAYDISRGGSDWREFMVRDVATGEDLDDHIQWAKFTGASWSHDSKGFYYSRYDAPTEGKTLQESNYHQKLYYHRVGTPQSEDQLVYEDQQNKDRGVYGHATEDGRFLILSINQGTNRENRVYYRDLWKRDTRVVKLLDDFDASYGFLGNDGPTFYFETDVDAPNGKVIAIDIRNPARDQWQTLIPESELALRDVNLVGDQFIASYLKDAQSLVRVFDLAGKHLRDVDLPGIGSAGGFGGRREDTDTFYSFTGYTTPPTIYRYDLKTGESSVFNRPRVKFNPADFETKQVFYTSHDGTRVPMFITHRKGLELDGTNPTYLYGYGGFNIPITPRFSTSALVWMELGGVYAVANIRGGGEYGKKWHDGGRLLNKKNSFKDFIAAAEWLIDNQYTRSDKLAIAGGSNGGLLVGACMTMRPDLFAAALPMVGVLDMLRFQEFTIGWAWTSDYGSSADPQQFKYLRSYSPLHNLQPGTAYPATMVMTGDHDDRVVPSHSFKFAARLQECQVGTAPALIRIETRAGHGRGKPTQMRIDEEADRWSFLYEVLNMGGES